MKNKFEWSVEPKIKTYKGWLLLALIGFWLYLATFVNAQPKQDKAAPRKVEKKAHPIYVQENRNALFFNVKELPGRSIKSYNQKELQKFLEDGGFTRLNGKSLTDLRRIYIAHQYDDFFWQIHKKTDLPISVLYAFFIIESTNNGIESDLMANALNPGGIKYRGKGKAYKAMDDCYVNGRKVKCNFQTFTTYQQMINGWSEVLNLPRYKKCKNFMYAKTSRGLTPKQKVDGTCKCLQKQGYHTAKQWKVRSDLSSQYWTVKKSFPIEYF